MAAVIKQMEDEDIFQKSANIYRKWKEILLKYGRNGYHNLSNADDELASELGKMKNVLFDQLFINLKLLCQLLVSLKVYERVRFPKTYARLSDVIYQLADSKTNQELVYSWFYEQMTIKYSYFVNEMFEKLFYGNEKICLDRLDTLIKVNSKRRDVSNLIVRKLNKLQAMNLPEEQIYKAVKDYAGQTTIDEFLLEYHMRHENYQKARDQITIMKNRKLPDKTRKKINQYLTTICIQLKDKEYYKQIVEDSLTVDSVEKIKEKLCILKEMCVNDREWREILFDFCNYRYSYWSYDKYTRALLSIGEYQAAYQSIKGYDRLHNIHRLRNDFFQYDPTLLQMVYLQEFKSLIDQNDSDALLYYLYDLSEMDLPNYWLETILYELLFYVNEFFPKRKKIKSLIENKIELGDVL